MSEVQMLITKYTAILLESAKMSEARNTTPSRSDGDWSSLDSARRKPWRRRTYAYRQPAKLLWKLANLKPAVVTKRPSDVSSAIKTTITNRIECTSIKG
ncbi:unnamed protein product [Pieris brassicae]|uniref:Uncharacterized protein n=1 Tax=Pieris brassicae TaxID=7116 RepID=A0A9P0XH37_PIEBR|nr:unnamed protein product [Pieris brassicae]